MNVLRRPTRPPHHRRQKSLGQSRLLWHPIPRRAYTLLEMVVGISLLSVLMTISGSLIVTMSRSERHSIQSAEAGQTLARLNELFRRDVHRAFSASRSNEAQTTVLTLTQANAADIRYAVIDGQLHRQTTIDGHTHREVFRITGGTWTVEVPPNEPWRVDILLRRTAPTVSRVASKHLPQQEWRLSAVLSLTPESTASPGDST